jgi:hypothetical protein
MIAWTRTDAATTVAIEMIETRPHAHTKIEKPAHLDGRHQLSPGNRGEANLNPKPRRRGMRLG